MKFPSIKDWLLENKNDGVTVMYPGGFRPMTGGHLDLITRYSRNPGVKEVRVIVGPKTRNGIDQELGVKIAKELTSHLPNVKVETSKYPSPLLTAYKEIENLKPGRYALGASSKGDDYKRVIDFTEQHQPGGKYYEGVPEGVSIEELAVNADPALFLEGPHKGQPISASTLRADVMEGDYEAFASGYPLNDEKQIKKVWDILQGVVVNESYTYGYINESVVPKVNKHMTHAEDLVILGGKEGMDWVLKMMWDLYEDLKGHTEKEDMKLSVKIDGCIHPETLIKTSEGYVKIIDIINNYPEKKYTIYGVDEKTFNIEEQECLLPRVNNNNKNWIKLFLEKGELIVTEDHPVYIKDKGWVEAKDLKEGNDILEINDI